MKGTKEQKGITLVALIITIIVLLILAVVAITAIKNDGIFAHANNAASKYNQAQKDEEDILQSYLNRLDGKIVQIENINLYNKEDMKIGYFVANNQEGANVNYMSTGYIEVEAGDEIYWCAYLPEYNKFDYELTTTSYHLQKAQYISTYDTNKNFIETQKESVITFDYSNNNAKNGWIVPDGVSYIRLSLYTNANKDKLADTLYICKNDPPKYYAEYNQTEITIPNYLPTFMPQTIQICEGTNFNIYNANIWPSLNSEELTFEWECDIGTSDSNGIVFNPISSDIGTHIAHLNVYDKSNTLIQSTSTNIEIVSSTFNDNKSILVIGDSLSNSKPWISKVENLSVEKLSLTATAISGASANEYYSSSTLTSSNIENPFYNSEKGTFDYKYYLETKNTSYDSVILFLGTNDIGSEYPNCSTAESIKLKAIVDNIKEYNADLPIYIVTPMTTANSNLRTIGAINLAKDFYSTFNSYNNVTIVPIELTVDSINDFGENDKIHPLDSGYDKIADAVYSAICANQ